MRRSGAQARLRNRPAPRPEVLGLRIRIARRYRRRSHSHRERFRTRGRGRPDVEGVPYRLRRDAILHPTSGWPSRVFSRDANRMSQARTNSLLTPLTQPRIFAMLTTGDLVRRTNVSIRTGRPEATTAVMMFPILFFFFKQKTAYEI